MLTSIHILAIFVDVYGRMEELGKLFNDPTCKIDIKNKGKGNKLPLVGLMFYICYCLK